MRDLPVMARAAMLCTTAIAALTLPSIARAEIQAGATSAASSDEESALGVVEGVVTDSNGRYVTGAEVRINNSSVVARTDTEGRFRFTRVPSGTHTITATYIGVPEFSRPIEVKSGMATSVNIALGIEEGEAIVVSASRPIAESEAAALQLQRSSTALVAVVAADSIGRFPDQNIAAALSRLPGVAVQRDQGQERFVSLRGARNNWTTISFDGINVISPSGRTTRFDTIPSSIASAVIVRKAVTAEMPGETVAGNIDVRTRGAFDYPGFRMAADLGLGYNELGGGRQYNAGGYISNRFFNDTVGLLLTASRYERDMITDNFEGGWTVRPDGEVWNNNSQNKLYRLTRSNTAFGGRLDWRPAAGHEFFLNSVHTEFRDDELRSAYVFDVDDSRNGPGWADASFGNTPFKGTIFGTEIDSTLNSNSSRQRIFTNTLGGDHELDRWGVEWRLNFTRAQSDSRPPFQSTWRSPADPLLRPTITYDLTDPTINGIRLYETIRNPDGSYAVGAERPFISTTELDYVTMTRNNQRDETDAYTARVDVTRNIGLLGDETQLQFGMQFDDRTKTSNRTVIEARAADLIAAGIALPRQQDISIDGPFKGDLPLGYIFRYFSSDLGEELLDSFIERGGTRIQPNTTEQNYYKVKERVLAGYLMGTSFFDWGNIVAGVRAENVENTSEANIQSTVDGVTTFTPTSLSSSQTMFFPSLHANWDLHPEMKLRLSFNTGAARPDYSTLRPNLTFNDLDQTVSGGNPLAKPEKARGVDLYYEWYMPSRGFFSIGLFYKDLSDVLFDIEYPQFGITDFDVPGFPRSTYLYETTGNGGSGSLKGLEVAFSQPFEGLARGMGLPDWMGGFGVQANLTLNDAKATTPDGRTTSLPGASDLLYNVSGYYEHSGFSARVSWQWRKAWLDSLGSDVVVGDNYWGNVGRLDLSMRYEINKNVELYFDANNLLDEPGIRYVGNPDRVIEFEKFGARYMWGARFNF